MRLRSISLRGLTRFTGAQPVTIDFDPLGPGLIALVGENGAGKTTLLETPPASLHKLFPSRPGSLYDYAHGRDAFVETVWDDAGEEVKVRVQIDAERRTCEGYIFVNGVSVTTGRSAEFEAEIERRFGSLALLLSSAFACQTKAGSFLQMKKADRKSLFVELLGLAYLEVLAESAKDRSQAAQFDLEKARVEVTGVEAEVAELPERREGLDYQESLAREASAELDGERSREADAIAQLERARGAQERLAALQKAEQAAAREVKSADKLIDEAADASEKAVTRYEERLRFLTARKVEELAGKANARHDAGMLRLGARRLQLEKAMKDAPDEVEARANLAEIEQEREGLERMERETTKAQADHKTAAAELRTAEARLAAAVKARTDEIARLTKTAGLLPQVPCTLTGSWIVPDDLLTSLQSSEIDLADRCPLLADARTARERITLLESGPSNEEEVAHTSLAAAQAREHAALVRRVVLDAVAPARTQRRDALKALDKAARDALARAQAAVTARTGLRSLAVEVDEEVQRHAQEIEDARQKVEAAAVEGRQIQGERDAAIAQAQGRLTQAQQASFEAHERHAAASMALSNEADGPSVEQLESVARVTRADRVKAEAALRQADQHLTLLKLQVEQLAAREANLPALRDAVVVAERELGDWSLLARALGKDGVQALEIDAAGPEVARITNELLEACYGPRFSISLETLREKKSARGEFAEAFDVRVLDAGAERPVEALSGGEKVVVGEALGLAISILNARKSGIRYETLWRDETAGALDPDNAQAYVLMMRRARELGGFSQVIFVSHQPEVWEAADVRLVVAGGRVTVEAERRAA